MDGRHQEYTSATGLTRDNEVVSQDWWRETAGRVDPPGHVRVQW
jgi:hypothetical protein